MKITIGTRGSDLAIIQTEIIKAAILSVDPEVVIDVSIIKTEGDKNMSPIPLDTVGKGWFTKEIEKALLDGIIDVAAHSLKDLPEELPDGLGISAITERGDVRDVLVSKNHMKLADLPKGAIIGTDSSRRRLQILHLREDLRVESVRGNVNTRLKKLHEGNYDALVLAAAGLQRLNMEQDITEYFDPTTFIPAPGQGALAVETRISDTALNNILQQINHTPTIITTKAERAFASAIGGGCKLPVGAYAVCEGKTFTLYGMMALLDGKEYIIDKTNGFCDEAEYLSKVLANKIITKATIPASF